ncbi:MAG: MBL fold metallo-hydrolase [Polyangiaceae bacterium]|nr:MBL fold metallo-hydrolase [Polyangiaceae bacterium]
MTTRLDEIGENIYRISTAVPPSPDLPPGFTFNQFLIVDDEPLLFHAGMRRIFPLVRDAVARVMPIDKLRWVSFSHHECDESGALNEWLAAAPHAAPLCGKMNLMYSVEDSVDRAARVLADGEAVAIGKRSVQWLDTPHVPHGWDAGLLFETTTQTLFCSDILAQPGDNHPPATEGDVLGPSEMMRKMFTYYSNTTLAAVTLERLASLEPAVLATMHGAAYRGDGGRILRELASVLAKS